MVGPAAPPLLGPLFTAAGGLLRAWLSMDPLHHGLEVLFLALFIHLATQTAYVPSRRHRFMPRLLGGRGAPPVRRPLSDAEAADRVAAWTPDALHVDTNDGRTAPGRPPRRPSSSPRPARR